MRRFNLVLTCVVTGLGAYIAVTPLLPELSYALHNKSPEARAPYAGKLARALGAHSKLPTPKDNRIVIPAALVDQPILEGKSIGVITKGGTWHRPQSAIPTLNGNSVVVAHSFYGSKVSTFYNLSKVKMGDKLAVYWHGEEVLYAVTDIKIVDPTHVEVEAPSREQQLTIYTCYPIWTAKNRLVLTAKPVKQNVGATNLNNRYIAYETTTA